MGHPDLPMGVNQDQRLIIPARAVITERDNGFTQIRSPLYIYNSQIHLEITMKLVWQNTSHPYHDMLFGHTNNHPNLLP